MSSSPFILSLADLPRAIGSRKDHKVNIRAGENFGTPSMAVAPDDNLDISVSLTSIDDGVLVQLRTEIDLVGECVRCLDEVRDHHSVDASDVFFDSLPEGADEEDTPLISARDTIDIENLLRDSIVTLVDPLPLCSADCLGLCQGCGEKWADLPDGHEHRSIDPRFAALEGLLGSFGAEDNDRNEGGAPAAHDATERVRAHADEGTQS